MHIISMYQPCKSDDPSLLTSSIFWVWLANGGHECPRKAVLNSIKQWQDEGDNIIPFMDMNDDIFISRIF